jgi:tetratricopeptide (TPR) repeat protein
LGDWLSARRTTVITATAVLTLTGAGAAYALQRRAEAQGAQAHRVVEAAELSLAQVRSAEDPPDPPNAPPRRVRTFSDHTARARAALAAAEQAMQGSSDLVAISIAKLQRGIALYDLGRYAEAKSALEALIGADLAGLEGRALETLGYCLESLNDLPGALRRFEELGRLDGEGWRDLSAYHQARVLRRQNQNDRAKDLLRRLIERVERARPDDTSTTASRSIVEQAKALLHEIAPEDPLGRRESAPTDPDAIMRMLRRQLGDNVQIRRPGQGEAP